MYMSDLDLIAISIAIVAQMMLNIILLVSAHRNRKQYINTARLLKRERAMRQYL